MAALDEREVDFPQAGSRLPGQTNSMRHNKYNTGAISSDSTLCGYRRVIYIGLRRPPFFIYIPFAFLKWFNDTKLHPAKKSDQCLCLETTYGVGIEVWCVLMTGPTVR